ncbi:MAG TPA: Gfo/Idh/MocA family oxidoreductase [Gemmatimonadaceae bacterium]|jgi:predicted dehydrogenase|nr:Gfo/Idh/MocA family oxidoreductase [Gemmatimonadaceae bacterium]
MRRRSFVSDIARAGVAAAVLPKVGFAARRFPRSAALNVACIGVGGMGASDVRGISALPDINIYAMCDVDQKAAAEMYALQPKAKRYKDYREMLAKEPSIDLVMVSTPDHSHAAASIMALRAGKHVYCQKPLARTLGEVRAMIAAAKNAKGSTQMGNQGHAGEGVRLIREWVESGVLGNVREVHFWTDRPIWPQAIERPTEVHNPPQTLDWDLWLGPAPERPYHPAYAPFRWRGWWDFGTGAMGDMACHAMDASFWVLGLRYPTRVEVETSTQFMETAPRASRVTYYFPAVGSRPEVKLVWRDGGLWPGRPNEVSSEAKWPPSNDGGQLWIGDNGKLVAGVYAENPRLLNAEQDAAIKAKPLPVKYPRVKSVYAEWVDACRAGTQPGSNFAGHAGPLTEMIALGNLAVRSGRNIELDAATGAVKSPVVPNEWLMPTYRNGWSITVSD